eukprot:2483662-Pyramimonas_sp.AAC.1
MATLARRGIYNHAPLLCPSCFGSPGRLVCPRTSCSSSRRLSLDTVATSSSPTIAPTPPRTLSSAA